MSKMACKCGGIISDMVCPCPTEGFVIGHQEYEELERKFVSLVTDFLEAAKNGIRQEWLDQTFGTIYGHESSDAEVIADLLSLATTSYGISIAECEICGRLYVQIAPERNEYRSFAPDEAKYHRVLARHQDQAKSST